MLRCCRRMHLRINKSGRVSPRARLLPRHNSSQSQRPLPSRRHHGPLRHQPIRACMGIMGTNSSLLQRHLVCKMTSVRLLCILTKVSQDLNSSLHSGWPPPHPARKDLHLHSQTGVIIAPTRKVIIHKVIYPTRDLPLLSRITASTVRNLSGGHRILFDHPLRSPIRVSLDQRICIIWVAIQTNKDHRRLNQTKVILDPNISRICAERLASSDLLPLIRIRVTQVPIKVSLTYKDSLLRRQIIVHMEVILLKVPEVSMDKIGPHLFSLITVATVLNMATAAFRVDHMRTSTQVSPRKA